MKKEAVTPCLYTVFLSIAISMTSLGQNAGTGENHALLASLAGNWSFTGKHFSSDPGKKPSEFSGTAVRKAIMDGRYFIVETTGGKLKMPWSDGKEVTYTDMSVEGYDNDKQKFVTATIDNHWSTGITTTEGVYDKSAGTITYGSGANVVKILDNDHYIIEIYTVKASQKIKRTEISYTRIKSAAISPGEFHRMLARSNGIWTGEGTIQFSSDTPPVNAGTSLLINTMAMDGLYQVSEIKGNTTPGMGAPWTGLRITGYDNARKVFTRSMIGDGASAGAVSMEGFWDEATRSITMPFKKTDPSTGEQHDLKEVYKMIDEDTEVLEIYATDPKTKKEFRMLNVRWTRKK